MPQLVPLFGAPNRDPSKNREMEGELTLGGCCQVATHNNQPKVGGRGRRDVGEEVQAGSSEWWGHCPIVWGDNLSDEKRYEIHCGLRQPPINVIQK